MRDSECVMVALTALQKTVEEGQNAFPDWPLKMPERPNKPTEESMMAWQSQCVKAAKTNYRFYWTQVLGWQMRMARPASSALAFWLIKALVCSKLTILAHS